MTAIIYCARLVREKGMRDLESVVGKSSIVDPFVRYGLNMVVSGYPADEVRAMMETAADATYERDSVPVDVLQAMASHAPAFGMVGTLVGMVAMLCSLSADVSNIGGSLAVSFLSTLYGVLSARMVYMPAAARTAARSRKPPFPQSSDHRRHGHAGRRQGPDVHSGSPEQFSPPGSA